MKGSLGRRLALTHLLVAAVALVVFALAVASALPDPAAAAVSIVAAGLVAAWVARATSRWVGKPLEDMAGSLATALGGHPAKLVPGGPAEVRQLAGALDDVATGLAASLAELHQESGLREQILSSMSEGVVLADASGSILYANPAANELLSGARILPAQLRTEGPVEMVLRHPRRRELKASCLRLEDGRRLVALQDVTEAKRIEAMRRDFVADASHELKTPVASIQAVAETLETAVNDDPEAVPRFMRILLAEIRRLSALVQDLLDLARLEGRPPARALVSLTRVVVQETSRVRPAAQRRGLQLTQHAADGVVVAGSVEDLSLAVRNLLDNALRYTLVGEVSVRLSSEDGVATIEVSDTGPGIPGKDLGRIFERFYRVDRARSRETGGTGLGLSIVRHVIEQHNGRVTVESELGKGSRFIVTLPAVRTPAP